MMATIILGSLMFGLGLVQIANDSMWIGWIACTVGLSVALRGVCEVTAELMARNTAELVARKLDEIAKQISANSSANT